MANVSRVNGFKPVKHITGAPYNGQCNIYEVPAAEAVAVFVGDMVKLSDSAPTDIYPAVEALGASAAGSIAAAPIVGVVVGIINAKMDPVSGKMSTGSIALDTPVYRAASTKQFILVADSPDIIFEAQADAAVALASVGLNAAVTIGTHDTTTGASAYQVDGGTEATTATLPVQIMGFAARPDNEAAATANKVLVRINTHAFGNVGVAGV